MSNSFAPDYVTVNERIEAFYAKHPEGSLQSEVLELSEARVVIRGLAYRNPDDPRPGIGTSSLTIPGKTPYTRDSEIENCETSAWGRALAALGFEVKRSVASHDEIASKGADQPATSEAPRVPAAPTNGALREGDVHQDGHRPLRARASGQLYCPTKLPNGTWCPWRSDAPRPAVVASAAPDGMVDLMSDDLPF